MSDRERILDKLLKLQERLTGKGVWPPAQCGDVNTHIAGMFLREHIGVFIEALKRSD